MCLKAHRRRQGWSNRPDSERVLLIFCDMKEADFKVSLVSGASNEKAF
jgi:hypothetical protein